MKSPFPGMDPYIEACDLWRDFHQSLIVAIKNALAEAVPEHYLVRGDERYYIVLVGIDGKESYPFLPDVGVADQPAGKKRTKRRAGAAVAEASAAEEPTVMRAFIPEEYRETFIEIYETKPEQRLVTSIEVLSPTNKRPGTEGRDVYLRKRHAQMLQGVNLVEIDLLRGGDKMPMFDRWPDTPYTLMVARAHGIQNCRVWSGHFRRPLPVLPVPLAKPDPDIRLDLQPMIEAIYKMGRYDRTIDYTRALVPPLPADDAAWLQQQLRSR